MGTKMLGSHLQKNIGASLKECEGFLEVPEVHEDKDSMFLNHEDKDSMFLDKKWRSLTPDGSQSADN
jgi:hypothetical protein